MLPEAIGKDPPVAIWFVSISGRRNTKKDCPDATCKNNTSYNSQAVWKINMHHFHNWSHAILFFIVQEGVMIDRCENKPEYEVTKN